MQLRSVIGDFFGTFWPILLLAGLVTALGAVIASNPGTSNNLKQMFETPPIETHSTIEIKVDGFNATEIQKHLTKENIKDAMEILKEVYNEL